GPPAGRQRAHLLPPRRRALGPDRGAGRRRRADDARRPGAGADRPVPPQPQTPGGAVRRRQPLGGTFSRAPGPVAAVARPGGGVDLGSPWPFAVRRAADRVLRLLG